MANTKDNCLFTDASWDKSKLPDYLKTVNISNEDKCKSPWNTVGTARLNGYVVSGIQELIKGAKSKITIIQSGENSYTCEYPLDNQPGTYLVANLSGEGKIIASEFAPELNRMTTMPQLGAKTDYNTTPLLMLCLMQAVSRDVTGKTKEALDECIKAGKANQDLPISAVFCLCDAVESGLKNGQIPCTIKNQSVEMLQKGQISSEELQGDMLYGSSKVFMPGEGVNSLGRRPKTIAEAKARVKEYTDTLHWSEEEKMLIPEFPDDFRVPEMVWIMIENFISTRDKRLKFNNFGWRGTSGYGKSTGVRILACILNTPLYVMSCHSKMEMQEFLCKYVPISSDQTRNCVLPEFDQIINDPEGAYFTLTGENKPNVTYSEVQKAYNSKLTEGSDFKLVESDYIRALMTGAIVEIQEYNIIKDSGVEKGLNAYDEPGAVIPLIDGSKVRRHVNAIIVKTGNIGYTSSREEEYSVSRRVRLFFDVFELDKKEAIDRVLYNIEDALDRSTVTKMYDVWSNIKEYCKDQQIHTDLSLVCLENWASCISRLGIGEMEEYCKLCVISQCTSDEEVRELLIKTVMKPALSKAKF